MTKQFSDMLVSDWPRNEPNS